MLISSSGGYSGLQTQLFLSVIWFLLTAMQRLNLWFAAHPEWLKLYLFQGTKATKWFRADFVFSQSQEVQKNISSWDSDFSPAQNLASNLILNFPDVSDSRPDEATCSFSTLTALAVYKILYPSFISPLEKCNEYIKQVITTHKYRRHKIYLKAEVKGIGWEVFVGSGSPPMAGPAPPVPFPAGVFIFLQPHWSGNGAEVWQGAVLQLVVGKCCLFPTPNKNQAHSAAAHWPGGSQRSSSEQDSNPCCCRSPSSAWHFQEDW